MEKVFTKMHEAAEATYQEELNLYANDEYDEFGPEQPEDPAEVEKNVPVIEHTPIKTSDY